MSEHETDSATLPLDPPLDVEEARVLGCLIEKEATTPESYPLTQNATVTACNQKTSRFPVMKLDPGRVGQALRKLEQRGFVKSDFGARATRYAHKINSALELTPGQRALICLLLLRGPQTLAELYSRSERQHRFDDLDDVSYNLDRLASRDAPLVICIGRAPGQREDRYMHRLCGPVDPDMLAQAQPSKAAADSGGSGLAEKVAALEARIARLEQELGLASEEDSVEVENES